MSRRALLRGVCAAPVAGLASAFGQGCSRRGSPVAATTQGPATPPTMRALSIDAYVEDLATLTPKAIPRVAAGPGEVLVRVQALSLNPVDVAVARGRFPGLAPKRFPAVLGWDLAGEVAQVGAGVEAFAVGQPVYATMGFDGGAFGEFAVVPQQWLAPAPQRLPGPERAALPLVACTTLQALAMTDLRPGGRVLVLGGAGGVGSTAVQWLRHRGAARVVATASQTKLDAVRALGAEVVDYRRDDWSEVLAGADFDVVFDTVGDEDAVRRATRVMRPAGHYVAIASRPGDTRGFGDGFHFHFCACQPSGADLRAVTEAVDAGGIDPLIFRRFDFDAIADAYALCAERVAVGKIVVAV